MFFHIITDICVISIFVVFFTKLEVKLKALCIKQGSILLLSYTLPHLLDFNHTCRYKIVFYGSFGLYLCDD